MIVFATATFNVVHPLHFWPRDSELPEVIEVETVEMLNPDGHYSSSNSSKLSNSEPKQVV